MQSLNKKNRVVRRRAFTLFSGWLFTILMNGCSLIGSGTNTQVDFTVMKTPSAIRYLEKNPSAKPANLNRFELGAVKENGDIIDITGLEMMWSYPLGDQMTMPDLQGIAFNVDYLAFWSTNEPYSTYHHIMSHYYVIEYTFPEATHTSGTEINWFIKPNLTCHYEIDEPSSSGSSNQPGPLIWLEYIIFEDVLGTYDLIQNSAPTLIGALSSRVEDEQDYQYQGDSTGTITAYHDERSGTMVVPSQGTAAKLFVGLSMQLRTYEHKDRIIIGGDSLPHSVLSPTRCTFDLGNDSYFTMRPAVQN